MNAPSPVLPDVAQGNSDAIEECIDRYSGLVWALARKRFSDIQVAEDAVQDVFIHLWQTANRFDASVAAESTFVAMIARRRLIDRARKQRSHPTVVVDAEVFDAIADGQQDAVESPAKNLETGEDAAKAARYLAELPEQQQQVIRLSVYDGLSHAKISETTGLSLGTVKTHIRRGIMKLRDRLFATDLDRPCVSNAGLGDGGIHG